MIDSEITEDYSRKMSFEEFQNWCIKLNDDCLGKDMVTQFYESMSFSELSNLQIQMYFNGIVQTHSLNCWCNEIVNGREALIRHIEKVDSKYKNAVKRWLELNIFK